MTDERSRFDALQVQLKARRSVFHFAHAAVSLLIAVVATCTAAKLFWDYQTDDMPALGTVLGVSGVLFVYGFVHWALGRRALQRELTLFSELQDLRQHLRLDDPSALLPR